MASVKSLKGRRSAPVSAGRLWRPACCAAALAVLVHASALDNPFVYDDFHLIVENSSILNPSNLQSVIVRDITRPLVTLSYAVDTWVWGRRPVGYHVTNLLLHVVNVLLVFWVAALAVDDRRKQSGQGMWREASPAVVGFATAAALALHPMMTQAVGYISGRSEVAYSTFFLLAFLAGRRWMMRGGARWWAACVALWLLALLSKESAAMLPLLLLAYDRLVLDADPTERRRRLLRLTLPMLIAIAAAGLGRVALLLLVEYRGESGPDWRYGFVAVDAFWRYLAMLFSPRGQSIFHAVPPAADLFAPRVLASVAGLAGYVALAWMMRRRHSLVSVGLVWFALQLVPSSALVVLGRGEPLAEHRVYLSAAGMFLVWGCAFGEMWSRSRQRALVGAAAALFLGAFAFQTLVRNQIWEDPVRLAREAVALAPDHWMPRVLAGDALRQSGRCDEAVSEYQRAIVLRAVEEHPYTMLARCLIEGRRLAEAESVLLGFRAAHPSSDEAAMGLGIFALLKGQTEESRARFQEVLARDASRGQARLMLAFLDGALSAPEHRRVCEALRTVAGDALTIAACAEASRGVAP